MCLIKRNGINIINVSTPDYKVAEYTIPELACLMRIFILFINCYILANLLFLCCLVDLFNQFNPYTGNGGGGYFYPPARFSLKLGYFQTTRGDDFS